MTDIGSITIDGLRATTWGQVPPDLRPYLGPEQSTACLVGGLRDSHDDPESRAARFKRVKETRSIQREIRSAP